MSNTVQIILCIDDQPARFERMYRRCAAHSIQVVVTDNPEFIRMVLGCKDPAAIVVGICLDHDMPGRDASQICHDLLSTVRTPIAVVSANTLGAQKLAHILSEYEATACKIPAGGMSWESRVLGFFSEHCHPDGDKMALQIAALAFSS